MFVPLPKNLRYKASTELGLEEFAEDWGAANASGERLEEFLDYYFQLLDDIPYERATNLMYGLIVESAIERFRHDSSPTNETVSKLKRFYDILSPERYLHVGHDLTDREADPANAAVVHRLRLLVGFDPVGSRIADDLGFAWAPYDMGIIAADPQRVADFLAYYEDHRTTIPEEEEYKFLDDMIELITCSAAEYLDEHEQLPADLAAKLQALWQEVKEHPAAQLVRSQLHETYEEGTAEEVQEMIGYSRLHALLREVD